MTRYSPEPPFDHGAVAPLGVLLVNLGTPDAPRSAALRRFLKEFLSDPRVVEQPRLRWWIVLNLIVLTFRPRKSAELYRSIWTEEGSPLLTLSRSLTTRVEGLLENSVGNPVRVALGMRYGSHSVAQALGELREAGCSRIVCLPLYPQYSATTTASTFDALFAELMRWRAVPELRTVREYHDDPRYIAALARSIEKTWDDGGAPDKLVFSYHGIPQRFFDAGDPYPCHCHKTTRLVAEHLGLEPSRYVMSFQSIFGREKWVSPATDATLERLAREGAASVDVICPGFAVDCLETLEEIASLNRDLFLKAGGTRFRYIPALNDSEDHAELIAAIVKRQLSGWAAAPHEWDAAAARDEAGAREGRAAELRERGGFE